MIKIRLARYGRKNAPFYRIIAVDSRKKREGSVAETLGFWNPIKNKLEIKNEKVKVLISKGAQITTGVAKLLTDKIGIK